MIVHWRKHFPAGIVQLAKHLGATPIIAVPRAEFDLNFCLVLILHVKPSYCTFAFQEIPYYTWLYNYAFIVFWILSGSLKGCHGRNLPKNSWFRWMEGHCWFLHWSPTFLGRYQWESFGNGQGFWSWSLHQCQQGLMGMVLFAKKKCIFLHRSHRLI